MAKSKKKKSKQKKEVLPPPPTTLYPVSPHVIGIEWIDWPVLKPALTEMLYIAMGFTWRGRWHGSTLLSIGAVVLRLHKVRKAQPMSLQMTVDQVKIKHKQMMAIGLETSRIRRQKRGDEMFVATDPNGHRLVVVGPVRMGNDPHLD